MFRLKKRHPVPYGTTPALRTILSAPEHREYIVSILEEAKGPEEAVLIRNISFKSQVGVFGHELAHVLQYSSCNDFNLIKLLIFHSLPVFQRRMERAADLGVILHGLEDELLKHALYIRSVPGYVENRKGIVDNCLSPREIESYMKKL